MRACAPTDIAIFGDADLDFDLVSLDRSLEEMLRKTINSAEGLEVWLLAAAKLIAQLIEHGARLSVNFDKDTRNTEARSKHLYFSDKVRPYLARRIHEIKVFYISCPHHSALPPARYAALSKQWQTDVSLYNEELLKIKSEESELIIEYTAARAKILVPFEAKLLTLMQVAKILVEGNREQRRVIWHASQACEAAEADRLDEIFDRLILLRHSLAQKSNKDSFLRYVLEVQLRSTHTIKECEIFFEAVGRTCQLFVNEVDRGLAAGLSVERLKPWDLSAKVGNNGARDLGVNSGNDALLNMVETLMHAISSNFGDYFRKLRSSGEFDLESRNGKAAGGYHVNLVASNKSIILMNMTGQPGDLLNLIHECGHALHATAVQEEPLFFLKAPPAELCEFVSMTFELLAMDHVEAILPPEEALALRRYHLSRILRRLLHITTLIIFEQWVYTHPAHSKSERKAAWLDICERFGSSEVDWGSHRDSQGHRWQHQLHLFSNPLQLIEYGFAQFAALRTWSLYRRYPVETLKRFEEILGFGASKDIDEIYSKLGLGKNISLESMTCMAQTTIQELFSAARAAH